MAAHRWSLLSILCLLLLVAVPAWAQTDQIIYADALQNGWMDWSWADRNLNNASPVHSGSRSISVTADAWEAFYARHGEMDTSGYTDLVFWIHGGSTGGQRLQLAGLVTAGQQPAIPIGPLAANTWQQFTIPLSTLGVANRTDFVGFWLQDSTGTTQPTFYLDTISLKALPPPTTVSVAVDAGNVIRTVDARQFAINTAIWDGSFASNTTIGLLNELGSPALRFPGGSLSDEYHWATNTTLNNTWQWATSFDEFAGVAQATNTANVFITANYGSGTPTEAADWVRYSNVTNGYNFKYWEIGNENYGSWETDQNTRPHDPLTYANRFKQYWDAMKAVDPTIKIGAVVVPGEDAYANYADNVVTNPRTGQQHSGWTPVVLSTLNGLGVTPDFIIYHHYVQAPGSEGDAGLLNSGAWASGIAADLRQQLTDYLGASGANVELVCTEYNSVYSNPGKQTTSLVNGLFLADTTADAMKSEFNALMWWDLRNGVDTSNNLSPTLYGWRQYGDYGIVNGDQPADPADRYPAFYTFKLLQHYARGGDQLVATTSNYTGLTAYASKRGDGSLRMLIVNKHPTNTLTANVSLSGFTAPGAATVYSYGIPQDEAARTGVGLADLAQSSASFSGASFSYAAAPYSANVIVFPAPATDTPPSAPTGLVAAGVSSSQINLDWANNNESDLAGYNVYRSMTSGGPYTKVNGSPLTSSAFNNTGLSPATTYHYVVTAVDAAGNESAQSSQASASTQAPVATVHVTLVDTLIVGIGKGKKAGQATVTVRDASGNPVANVTVTGTFSGALSETRTGVTNASGVAVIRTAGTVGSKAGLCFCVTNLTHATLTYDPSANADRCDFGGSGSSSGCVD